MKLVTTMGVELTYVPAVIQIALNRGAAFNPDEAPDRNIVQALVQLVRYLVDAKKIPVNYVGTDPGCVEISTLPYKNTRTLLAVARKLRKEAEAMGLVVAADYTTGGGAHVHTGIMGGSEQERKLYAKRMTLFGAMNPWLSWATCNVNDDINAKPLTASIIINQGETAADLRNKIKNLRASIVERGKSIHKIYNWADRRCRAALIDDTENMAKRMGQYKLQLRRAASRYGVPRPLLDVDTSDRKEYMLRKAYYGDYGTMEFRCFEMGGEDKIGRNLKLANAICDYVSKWDINHVDPASIYYGAELCAMKWSEARKGWLNMLTTLGLDPAEYREETAQIARRWRYCRSVGSNTEFAAADRDDVRPTAPAAAFIDVPYAAFIDVRRAQARQARRACRNGRFTALPEGTMTGGA